jgi:hypothetical protein
MERLLPRPTLAFAFWRASMLEAAVYRERLSSTGRGTAFERVAHLLCEQLARREAVGIHTPRLPFSQIDVADAAGLSVVHVNRTIQTLRSLGVLSKASHIEVIDRERLEQLAKFDGLYLSPAQFCRSPLGSAALARLAGNARGHMRRPSPGHFPPSAKGQGQPALKPPVLRFARDGRRQYVFSRRSM